MAKKALGKGLNSIFEEIGTPVIDQSTGSDLHTLPVEKIDPNPYQPRRDFRQEEIAELAESITEKGLLQPILVRKHQDRYQIIAGERRWRAFCSLNNPNIPAAIRDKVTDRDMMELSLIENIQRVQLSPIEEALAYQNLSTQIGLTHEEIAQKLGKSRSTITNTIRLLTLPDRIQSFLRDNKLTFGHGKALLALAPEKQMDYAERILNENLTVRESENLSAKADSINKAKPVDANLKHLVHQLQYHLNAKVSVKGNEQKGKILIEYLSADQLMHIVELIQGNSPSHHA